MPESNIEKKEFISIILIIVFASATFFTEEAVSFASFVLLIFTALVLLSLKKEKNDSIQKLQEKFSKLAKKEHIDPLTGLSSRQSLCQNIDDKNVMVINIERFSTINSIYGLENGDKVLSSVAELLRGNLKETVFRFGSDDFIVLFDDADVEAEAVFVRDLFKEHTLVVSDNLPITIDVTIGVAIKGENVLEKALMALKYAKKTRQSYVIFSNLTDCIIEGKDKVYWIKLVREAIKMDNIIPYVQSVTDKVGKTISYEVQIRIQHNKTIILPEQFLDVIKETKFYPELINVLLEKTFSHFKDTDKKFAINLSSNDISNHQIRENLIQKVEQYEIGRQLIIEITEDEMNANFDNMRQFVDKIRGYGAKIAIDNFGAKNSNYLIFTKIKVDYIKIDDAIIKDIYNDINMQNILQSIILFAKKMEIQTIAQNVTTESMYEVAKEMGVDLFQGFFFDKPRNMIK